MKISIALILVLLVSGCSSSRYVASNYKSYKHCKEQGTRSSYLLPEYKRAPLVKAMVTNRKTAECYIASENPKGNSREKTSNAIIDALQQCHAVTNNYSDCGVVAVNKFDISMNYENSCEAEFNGKYARAGNNKAIALAAATNNKKEKNRCFVSDLETNFDTPDDAIKDALLKCMKPHLWGCVVYAVNDQNIDYEDFHLRRYSLNADLSWKYGRHSYYVTKSGNRSPYGEMSKDRNERKYRKEVAARKAAKSASDRAYAREKASDRAHQRRLNEIANSKYYSNGSYSGSSSSKSSSSKKKSKSSSSNKKSIKTYCFMTGNKGSGANSKLYFSSIFSSTNKKRIKNSKKWKSRFERHIGGTNAQDRCHPDRAHIKKTREMNYKNAKSSVRKYGVKTSWSP